MRIRKREWPGRARMAVGEGVYRRAWREPTALPPKPLKTCPRLFQKYVPGIG